ncbi:Putative HAD-hydrolase YfnB [bacterium HR15]|nr:Putative HAD-hydrolase YfnB [bacterium HR15]
MRVQAVGFDLDDTLCLYMPIAQRARRQAFAELVQPLLEQDIETIEQAYQQAFWQMMDEIKREPWRSRYLQSGEPTRTETMRRMLTLLNVPSDGLAEQLSARYLQLRESQLQLFEDTLPVLNALREQYRLFLITNGPAQEQRRELRLLGLEPYFEVVAIEGELGVGKPDPAIFLHVQEQLRLDPKQILFVGNSWEHDVQGALRVGWQAAWLDREGMPVPEPNAPVPVLRSLQELRTLLL